MRLRTGVALLAGGMAALAMTFMGFKVDDALTRENRAFNRQILTSMAAQLRFRLDRRLYERFREVQNAASIDTLAHGEDADRQALLERVRDSYADYAWIGLTNGDGRVVVSAGGLLLGQDVSAEPWFVAGRAGAHVGDVHEAALLERLLPQEGALGPMRFVDLAAPVRDPQGQVLGVLGAHLSWSWADEIATSILGEWGLLDEVEILILRHDGAVLTGPPMLIGQALPCPMAADLQDGQVHFARTPCANGTMFVSAQAATQGFRNFPGLGWTVMVRQNETVSLATLFALRWELAVWGAVLALSTAGLGWFAAGRITQPLQKLALTADTIRRGGRNTPLPKASAYHEFKMLIRSLQSMIQELTESQQRSEAAAAETVQEKRRLDAVVASMSDALAIVRDGQVDFANPTFLRLLGADHLARGALPSVQSLIHPEDRAHVAAALQAVTEGAESDHRRDQIEARIITPEGKTRHVEASLSAYIGTRGPGALMILRDVTERILTARQLAHSQRIEALGNMAGGIAHDFNNLLTVIVGNLDLLDDSLQDAPKARAQAAQALEAALRGAQLTRQLLTFSRMRALDPQRLDLNALLTGTASLLQRTLGDSISIITELDPDLWQVDADRTQMESAITNLAINSRDAMPDGGTLLLRTENRARDGAHPESRDGVVVEVIDTGTGIDPDVLPHVLEPFFTTKAEGKGTGLGLPMVQGFVVQSGGTITLESAPGHGTRIRLVFPRSEGIADAKGGEPAAPPTLPDNLSVLLIEDSDDVRSVLGEQLRRLGCRVTEAPNGPVALDRLDAGFDLLLTDIRLPGGMHGTAIAAAARSRQPNLPVVFITGYAGLAPDEEASLRRMGAMVDKPFRLPDLLRAIRIALDRKAAARIDDAGV